MPSILYSMLSMYYCPGDYKLEANQKGFRPLPSILGYSFCKADAMLKFFNLQDSDFIDNFTNVLFS